MMELAKQWLEPVIQIARESGAVILEYYKQGNFDQMSKSDETPVTSADLAAHKYLVEALTSLTPGVPVLSEEDTNVPFELRRDWQRYWLVDPLDGTQEFIDGSGHFATLIALVDQGQPMMGVIFAPHLNELYFALRSQGAYKIDASGQQHAIQARHQPAPFSTVEIAISRRQNRDRLDAILSKDFEYKFVPFGSSSIKSCMVAEGTVDCYVRIGPTGEWDTAAAQIIVEEAGGALVDVHLEPLTYNQRESFENPNFITLGDRSQPWEQVLQP